MHNITQQIRHRLLILILLVLYISAVKAESRYRLSGVVRDKSTAETLPYATLIVKGDKNYGEITDEEGVFRFAALPEGNYQLLVSYTGYTSQLLEIELLNDRHIAIQLTTDNLLQEVVITASQSKELVTASTIGRDAMQHLQPTSFADLMELLPGGISTDPDMASVNSISMRETGSINSDGTKGSVGSDYSITSLGTQFVVDGVPMNTDANLQALPVTDTTVGSSLETVNKGVDMRTISTDDIERVEVIRGVPSAEYGNLTSGVINITKIRKETPLNARFKADGYSKLFSAGKGTSLSATGKTILNADLGYMDAKPDPRNDLVNYKRLTASLRLSTESTMGSWNMRYTPAIDFTHSVDDVKTDPEINYGKTDTYESSYNRLAITNNLRWWSPQIAYLKGIELNTSVNGEYDKLERHKLVSPQRYMIVPSTDGAGEHDAKLLFSEYEADYLCEGIPFNAFVKLKGDLTFSNDWIKNDIKLGGEWSYTKNFGQGEVYDLETPLTTTGWSSRPRAFSDIPALQNVGFYAEDLAKVTIGNHTLDAMLGMRASALVGLDDKYTINNKLYLDPRVNLLWHFPHLAIGNEALGVALGGGIGWTTKMPTLDYLFPNDYYEDIVQLGYYSSSNPSEYSRFNILSYVVDRTNYDLTPARNKKWEVRMDVDFGANRLSANYFLENMDSGFRYMSTYQSYDYKSYDASSIVDAELTAPPSLENLSYEAKKVLGGYTQAENGSSLVKEGVEFQLNLQRIKPIRTAVTINGAWFRSTYSNSQMMARTVTGVIGDVAISDMYVGLYDWNEGNVYQQFNTNFLFDTQVPEWGLIFSTSVQCMWFTSKQALMRDGTPHSYISAADGEIHPFDEAAQEDIYLQQLIISLNDGMFEEYRVPTSVYVNFKASKRIGKHLTLALFANRMVDYTPDFVSNGVTIRRNVNPYFGMELNFKL